MVKFVLVLVSAPVILWALNSRLWGTNWIKRTVQNQPVSSLIYYF
jgi:hypothetical protein